MNKTITIYELLRMIKNGKAPKTIKYDNYVYNFFKKDEDYIIENNDYDDYLIMGLFMNFSTSKVLNTIVEIIEDNDKLEKIKWGEKESRADYLRADEEIEILARRTETLKKKIAELVDHINELEEKLNERNN